MEPPEHGDLAALLPEHVLADVLRRVATPRWLAVSRCVCKAWRAIIDGESLLCTDLPFTGMFIYYDVLPFPEFFSRPPSPCWPDISGKLDLILPLTRNVHCEDDEYYIADHCNGLILIRVYAVDNHALEQPYYAVVNPATRRWDTLPSCPSNHAMRTVRGAYIRNYYLAFDPMASTNYQVFRIPYLLSTSRPGDEFDPLEETSEWPPSPYILHVFSQRKRCWEERSFVRDGDAVGTVAENRVRSDSRRLFSICWGGSLYVHCQTNFVMRISLSEDKYIVIRPPTSIGASPYLGRSEKGVYFASYVTGHIRVFILSESCDQTEWIFKYDYDLKPVKAFSHRVHGPWILEDINYDLFYSRHPEIEKKEVVQDTFEWNSDNDGFDDNKDVVEAHPFRYDEIDILGFHPYKEILFLCSSRSCKSNATGFAYHLNSFKVETLGSIYPTVYDYFDSGLPNEDREIEAFPYTPCSWIEDIPGTEN